MLNKVKCQASWGHISSEPWIGHLHGKLPQRTAGVPGNAKHYNYSIMWARLSQRITFLSSYTDFDFYSSTSAIL
jgi:hypothetical protein